MATIYNKIGGLISYDLNLKKKCLSLHLKRVHSKAIYIRYYTFVSEYGWEGSGLWSLLFCIPKLKSEAGDK